MGLKTKLSALFIGFLVLLSACSQSEAPTRLGEKGALGTQAMVVTAHPIATKIGVEVLKTGGNAIDATIAIQFALAVVYPRAGNIGGGGFAVIRLANGEKATLDFREKAPKLSTRDMYLDELGEVITDKSTLGHLAAGTPGSVAGMWELHHKYGSLAWSELLSPAINVARQGFVITSDEAEALNEKQEDFRKANNFIPWVIKDQGWNAGDSVTQKDLAKTLTLIRDFGRDGFYKGEVAELIVSEMKNGSGIITKEDLSNYEPVWRSPIIGTYKGHEVISMPPPSSGGIAIVQLLKGAEQNQLSNYAHNSTEAVNLMAEIEKRVFADRAKFIGDPDFYNVPVKEIISDEYCKTRFDNLSANQFTPSSQIEGGKVPTYESNETTHFSVVDALGNAVSLTTTLNLNYGSKVWVKGAGFVLNNEMDDFSSKPGVPNFFGLIGAEANAIAPNKRMVSSMTPTIVVKDGQLKMVLGTPGGATIITSVFQTMLNVIDYNMTMQEAVNAKKIHHQWLPDQIKMEEDALDSLTIDQLKRLGHQFQVVDKIGRNDCILIYPDGMLEGGADDTRGDDYAEGY